MRDKTEGGRSITLVFRAPHALALELKKLAADSGRSLGNLIVYKLAQVVRQEIQADSIPISQREDSGWPVTADEVEKQERKGKKSRRCNRCHAITKLETMTVPVINRHGNVVLQLDLCERCAGKAKDFFVSARRRHGR